MTLLEQAQAKLKRWRDDPLLFVTDELKATPDKWQVEFLRAFGDPKKQRISEQACAGPGKTSTLAWAGLHFLVTQGEVGEHPKGAAVSITSDNLKNNLWPEFSKWMSRSPFISRAFQWTKERIFCKDHPETWFMSAATWQKKANPDEQGRTLSGLHSKYVLYLIDESGDIRPAILKAAEQGLSNCKWGKIIQAGNPTSQEGLLYAAATTLRHLWHIIQITGDPDDAMRSPRINLEWAREQIKTYGRDNPWVMAYILGKFPPSSINTLLGVEEVQQAMARFVAKPDYDHSQKRIGVDAARFGDDPWVIFPRQGLQAFPPVEMRNPRTHEVAARIALAKQNWAWEQAFFDDTGGYSAGAIDACIQGGMSPTPINFSGKADDPRYFNKRSEIWFRMAEWVKRGGCLPNVPQLVGELTVPTYTFFNGKFRLEEKEQIKLRLGRSPNYGDSLALTFAWPDMPAGFAQVLPGAHGGRMVSDFDPYGMKAETDAQSMERALMEAMR